MSASSSKPLFPSLITNIRVHYSSSLRINVTQDHVSSSDSACKADKALWKAKLELYYQCGIKGEYRVHVFRMSNQHTQWYYP
jgi:hypothetical protein